MEAVLAVVLGCVAGMAGLLYLLKLARGSRLRLPPERTGWIPWLGCALDFGRAPLHFIQKTREALGDVFTIHVTGRRMTFVANQSDFKCSFFQNSNVSFQAAVQPFTMRAAGLSTASFFKYHSDSHDAVKAKLVPSYVSLICPRLCRDLHDSLSKLGSEEETDLMEFVRHAMFDSVVRQLFGSENLPHSDTGMRELERKFVKFDQDFEYGTQLPEFLIREWSECKHWLLAFFKKMVDKLRSQQTCGDEQLMIEKIIDTADSSSAHNYALLFLWASQANAIPIVFWSLGHILDTPGLYHKLQNDIKNVDFFTLNEESFAEGFRSTMSVRRCVMEAMRLHAPGMITRKVTSTHKIGGYDVPAGHYLMLSPYWAHRDSRIFPDPESFNPERWVGCDLEKNQFLNGFVGFGGGRYQCPGRWLAVAEMHLCVAVTLQMFDMKLLDPLPDSSPLHLIGVQQPKQNCRVSFRQRK